MNTFHSTGHVQSVTDVYGACRMNMSSANAYSSIVDSLVNHAEWFFPGGKCELHVVTEVRLCQVLRGWTIKFANLPPCACCGSTGQKP